MPSLLGDVRQLATRVRARQAQAFSDDERRELEEAERALLQALWALQRAQRAQQAAQ